MRTDCQRQEQNVADRVGQACGRRGIASRRGVQDGGEETADSVVRQRMS